MLEWPIEIISESEIAKKKSSPENEEEPRPFFHHIRDFHMKNSDSETRQDENKVFLDLAEEDTPLYFSSNFAVPAAKGKPKLLPIAQAVLEHTVSSSKKALVLYPAEAEALKARLQQEVRERERERGEREREKERRCVRLL